MQILLIPSSYPPVLGGLQAVVHTLARNLLRQQHKVRVITNRYPRSLPTQEVIEDVAVERRHFLRPRKTDLTNWRPDLFLSSLFFYPATRMYLHRTMRDLRPDVVNVHFPDAQIPFILALRRHFDFRLVVSLHGHDIERCSSASNAGGVNGSASASGRNLLRLILKESDAITACSANLLASVEQLLPAIKQKSYVIHNGVDLEAFKTNASYRHIRPYLLSYGRLTFKKGFDMLLNAFAAIAPLHPDVDLILAGSGEAESALRKLSEELNLTDRVIFWGRASQNQVVELLNGCLFLVVPSRLEPFGIAALEGMAAGKPVLATNVGGLPEFLEISINKLVSPAPEDLAAGMMEWLANREALAIRGLGNRTVAARYDWKRTVAGYLRAYTMAEATIQN